MRVPRDVVDRERQDNHGNGDLAGRGREKADNSIGRENVHRA